MLKYEYWKWKYQNLSFVSNDLASLQRFMYKIYNRMSDFRLHFWDR